MKLFDAKTGTGVGVGRYYEAQVEVVNKFMFEGESESARLLIPVLDLEFGRLSESPEFQTSSIWKLRCSW